MLNDTESRVAVHRLCRLIRVGSVAFVVAVTGLFAVTSLWPDVTFGGHPFALSLRVAGLPVNALASLPLGERLAVASFSVPYLVALLWAFWRLDRMLRGFERSQFFERATVGHLRAFAGWLLAAKALSVAAGHLRVGALMHWLGPERVHPVMNVSSDDVAVLLLCALLFLIARMMEVGRDLADENRSFV